MAIEPLRAQRRRDTDRDRVARRLGFASFTDYLVRRHRVEGWTVSQLCAETGLERARIAEGIALSFHDLPPGEWAAPAERANGSSAVTAHRAMTQSVAGPSEGPWVSCGAVARMLGVSISTVRRAVRRRELAAWHTPGGHCRVAASDARAYASSLGITTLGA